MKSIAIVGASLAGVEAARVLRAEGFDGRLTLIGAEPHPPYDRPPLSKGFLLGALSTADLALVCPDEHTELELVLVLGRCAVGLDHRNRAVVLDDGHRVRADGVVLATGARARTLPGIGRLAGVHTLRTLDDAIALQAALRTSQRLVVVGAGFVGAEVASTARSMGLEVTVVEAAPVPLLGPLGAQAGEICAQLHRDHGVRLITGVAVETVEGVEAVTGVRLAGGRLLPAEVVVVGVGTMPAVEWLAGSGIAVDNGVRCDASGVTSIPQVVAAGDCASWWSPRQARQVRHEHWSAATDQARRAASRLLRGTRSGPGVEPDSYSWSDQYGVRLQLAGRPQAADRLRIVEGSIDDRRFAALYEDEAGRISAVLAMNQPRTFGRLRHRLATQNLKPING